MTTQTAPSHAHAEVDYAAVQAAAAARYQAALARAGGDRTAVDADGKAALVELVDSIGPLLRKIAHEKLQSRFPGQRIDAVAEDAYAEMVAAVIDAAGRFDATRCPAFHSWVTGKQGDARLALKRAISYAAGQDGFDARAQRALSIAAKAEEELERDLGRKPTVAELQEEMTSHCYTYQYERLTAQQQALPEEEWRKLVHAKLVNSGMRKAIDDIAVLRQRSARAVSPEEFATGWDFVESADCAEAGADDRLEAVESHTELGELVRVALAGLGQRDKQIVAARLAGRDEVDASLSAVASRYRVTVAEVKDLVAQATARMGAAHAHFAFLAPGVTSQFEDAPIPSEVGGVQALLARMRPVLT